MVFGFAAPAFAASDSSDKAPLKAGTLIDINTASAAELRTLPDIGAPRSNAIIAHRPYKQKEDLINKKIISAPVYDKIKDNIVATGGTRK
jgi:competence protein ComEA